MIDGIEIAEDADGAAEGAQEKKFFGIPIELDCGAFLQENKQGEKHCHEIAEKAFLHGGQISRKVHKQIHQRKGKGGKQDAANAFIFLCH